MTLTSRRATSSVAVAQLPYFLIPCLLVFLVAFFLRVYDLGHTPLGAHYDEAANAIIADEIAHGWRPIFIEGYTGKEVLFFYLAAVMVKLIGHPLIGLRLNSTFISMASLAITYRMTLELFRQSRREADESGEAKTAPGTPAVSTSIALVAMALQALTLWPVAISRLGFRVQSQHTMQALTILLMLFGLRRNRWRDWIWAGLSCGLAAYTYLAVRAFPFLLALFLLWIILFIPAPGGRWQRVRQIGLFLLVAAVVFAPLGVFFWKNPQFFLNRIGQVSVFATQPGGEEASPWAAFWHAARVSFGVFTARGDQNWRFNVAGAPALWLPVGIFFYVGLLFGLHQFYRFFRQRDVYIERDGYIERAHALTPYSLTPYLLLLLWLPIMLLPSILGGEDVEISLTLRAVGVMPAMFIWPAVGMVGVGEMVNEIAGGVRRRFADRFKKNPGALCNRLYVLGIVLLLLATGGYTFYQVFYLWGPSVGNYYGAAAYLVDAANYLNADLPAGADCYVSIEHYRHPTLALLAHRYADLKWLIGPDAFALPAQNARETWYVFTWEAMPSDQMLLRTFGSLGEAHLAPDGQVAFRVYRFAPGQVVAPQPQYPADANLGNTLHFLGYDLNAPPVSGGVWDGTLYFQVYRQVTQDDYAFFAHLVDGQSFQWGGQTFFTYPSGQWRPGEMMAMRVVFDIWKGAPPAAYWLDVGAYSTSLDARLPVLNEAGQLAGTAAQAGPIQIARAPAPPEELPPIQHRLEQALSPELLLVGYDLERTSLRPGERIVLSLYWRAASEIKGGRQVLIGLYRGSDYISLWKDAPVHGQYPFSQWQPGEFVRDRYALRLPTDLPAGSYPLRLALMCGEKSVMLGDIQVQAADRLWEPPAFGHAVGAQLGDRVRLLGYDLDRTAAVPGETIHLTLVWQCLKEMDTAYTVFTHLLDANQQVRGQKDNPPKNGAYPTTLWVKDEVVVDEYDIVVKPDTPPGTHVIEVGMYDPPTLQRLPVFDPTGAVGGGEHIDRILLGTIEIGK